jgi:hypothetical protein
MDVLRRSWAPVQLGLVILVVGLLGLPLAAVARAAEPGRAPALCTVETHDTASPGWLITPSQGTAHGLGTLTCVGALHGKQLTGGPGRFEWWYSYESSDVPGGVNNCVVAGGHGTWQVNLPSVDGSPLALTGAFRWVGSAANELHGQLGGLPVEMAWEALSEPDHLDEDCVTKPASHYRVLAQGTVG